MTELEEIFAELGISQYLHDFIEQGFDTWDTILDIKESDFDALGVKLGHRRKIQRRIANARGISADTALESPPHAPLDERNTDEQVFSAPRPDGKEIGGSGSIIVQGAKRKYRRHPKPDDNAPERPPSAYVLFSNKTREDLKGRNLSFTEIAKLVGEHWQNLAPQDKEPYEQQAATLKETYSTQLAEYKTTDEYQTYTAYLVDFKAKQSNQQPTNDTEAAKRPKLEPHRSYASTGTTSSGGGIDTPGTSYGSSAPTQQDQWPVANAANRSYNAMENRGHTTPTPPPTLPGTVLPGFRESIYGNTHQPLPWRDGPRDEGAASLHQLSRTPTAIDRRSSQSNSIPENRNLTGSAQHSHRTGHSPVSSLLSSESTNTSTSSSMYFAPRTPMELPPERGMPLPSLYSQKSTGNFDNQLPPLRPSSLSPQTTSFGPHQSPTGIHPSIDFPQTIPPLRGYGPLPPHVEARHFARTHPNRAEDNLDPVDALLKASDIVNRNSESRS